MDAARRLPLLALGLLAALAERAEAAGFALKEQSGEGQGASFAGASAGYGGLGVMFFNPAVQGLADGVRVDSTLAYARAGFGLDSASASTVLGSPIAGSSSADDVGIDALIPALAASAPIGEHWRVGLSVNAPFGLGTDYREDWVGRYHALRSELVALAATPSLAWTPDPRVTLAGGLIVQYTRAKLSNAVDFGTIGAVVGGGAPIGGVTPVPGGQDGRARIDGDDIALGFTLGVLAEPVPGTRIGLGFRSRIENELDGDAEFDPGPSGMGTALVAATGQFVDTGAKAALDLPAMASLGISQKLGERWTLLGEVQWTGWSSFDSLNVAFDNPRQAAVVTEEAWDDSWFVALGVDYAWSEQLSLRAGVAFDQTPVGDAHRTPRVPDSDRTWLSVGASWKAADWLSLTVGYSHIVLDDATIALRTGDPGGTFRGNLDAETSSSIDIVAIQASLRF
jgi:long-chain fatty acid transport protein